MGSEFEDGGSTILLPMVFGEETRLLPKDRKLVASWTYKTALMFALTTPPGFGKELPDSLFREFRQTGLPAPRAHIWIGARRENSSEDPPGIIQRRTLSLPELDIFTLKHIPHSFIRTMAFRHFVAQIVLAYPFERDDWSPEHRGEQGFALVKIWPPAEATTIWPPPAVLDEMGYERLGEEFLG